MKTNKNLFSKLSYLASIFPWILYALAWIYTGYLVRNGLPFWISYIQAVVFFNAGIQGLWAATAHLLFPNQTAKSIGWKSASGFQTEIGATNLAFGITGLLSFFFPMWAIPVALMLAIFFAGCSYIHIKERLVKLNDAPCNSGPMLYNTILISASLFVCLIVVGLLLK